MIFSSNQEFLISGNLNKESVIAAINTALTFSGENESPSKSKKLVYQVSKGGHYCIGLYWDDEDLPEGWKKFSFDASLYKNVELTVEMVALHIIEYLSNQDYTKVLEEYSGFDGGISKGFLMKCINYCSEYNMPEEEKIKNPWRGIVSFEPFACYYAK